MERAITTTESPLDASRLSDILGRRVSAVSIEASNPTVVSHVYRLRLAYDGDAAGVPVTLFLKTGHLDVDYFRQKYGVDVRDEFRSAFEKLQRDGWLTMTGESVDCTPDGLMQIDRHLPAFFDPQYISSRYT